MTSEENPETTPRPGNPDLEGLQTVDPPGVPQHEDGASTQDGPGHDDDASGSPAADQSAEEAGGHTIDIDDEQPNPDGTAEEEPVQRENAETSLDQPSQ
jgi:hypothetical protein